MYADDLLRPWWEALGAEGRLVDVHTRVGTNDPSGFSATVGELRTALSEVDADASVSPPTEPGGHRAAGWAASELGSRLVAFARVAPGDDPAGEARRCVVAGAAGIELHPATDESDFDADRLTEVFGLAHELHLPVPVHAGPESDPFGATMPALLGRFPGAPGTPGSTPSRSRASSVARHDGWSPARNPPTWARSPPGAAAGTPVRPPRGRSGGDRARRVPRSGAGSRAALLRRPADHPHRDVFDSARDCWTCTRSTPRTWRPGTSTRPAGTSSPQR